MIEVSASELLQGRGRLVVGDHFDRRIGRCRELRALSAQAKADTALRGPARRAAAHEDGAAAFRRSRDGRESRREEPGIDLWLKRPTCTPYPAVISVGSLGMGTQALEGQQQKSPDGTKLSDADAHRDLGQAELAADNVCADLLSWCTGLIEGAEIRTVPWHVFGVIGSSATRLGAAAAVTPPAGASGWLHGCPDRAPWIDAAARPSR